MPPKKAAATEEVTSSSDVPIKYEKVSGKAKSESSKAIAVARKNPSSSTDDGDGQRSAEGVGLSKGVSSQAICGYITETYPSVDLVMFKYMICKTLNKGIEDEVLVRPPNSIANGAQWRFWCTIKETTGNIDCECCARSFFIQQIPSSNLFMVVVDNKCDCSSAPLVSMDPIEIMYNESLQSDRLKFQKDRKRPESCHPFHPEENAMECGRAAGLSAPLTAALLPLLATLISR